MTPPFPRSIQPQSLILPPMFLPPSVKLAFSVLSNGNHVQGALPIGSLVQTQWGPRKVVSVVVETLNPLGDSISQGERATSGRF